MNSEPRAGIANGKSHKVRRIKLSDQIAEELRRWIARDNLGPGDRLPNERSLMERYGCSKGTMREALKALEVEGLVAIQSGPNGGAQVQAASVDAVTQQLRQYLHFQQLDFRHVYELRKTLEVTLALSVVGKLTDEQFRQLEENVAACDQATEAGNRIAGRVAELQFHDILCIACENPILVLMCRFLNSLLRDLVKFRSNSLKEHEEFGDSNIASHKALLIAFKAQDREAVRRIMADHMCCAESFMCRLDASFHSDLLSRGQHREFEAD